MEQPNLVYKREGKFLNWFLPAYKLKVIKAQKFKKPLIEFENTMEKIPLLVSGWDKIGQLSDFLEIPRNQMRQLVISSKVEEINKYLLNSEKILQINASLYDGNLWIFAFSTELHKIVTFTQIRNIVKPILSPAGEVIESNIESMKSWKVKLKTEETAGDKFDVLIRVTSGKNTLDSAIKVIVYVRVHSCNNSIRAAIFQTIKRTTNCLITLEESLKNSLKVAGVCMKAITLNAQKGITLEQGLNYIDQMKFEYKIPEKEQHIKELLKARFQYEFNKNPNRFGLSQTLSFVGTHGEDKDLTEYASETMQQSAYNVFTSELLTN